MTIAITLFLAALLQHSGFAQAMVTFYANGVFELVTAFSGLYFTYQDTNWGWRWVFFLSHSYQTWPALMTIQFADFVVDCASKPTNRFDCLLAANGNELLNQFDLVPAGAWAGLATRVVDAAPFRPHRQRPWGRRVEEAAVLAGVRLQCERHGDRLQAVAF